MTCVNWMRYDAVRETVADYEEKWGAPDGSTNCDDLSDFNIARNCTQCNMRPKLEGKVEELFQIANMFKEPAIIALEKVGMHRKCYKAD